jgi:GH25 family lysozyme M1 (1,4-beta-N-acetylmuramidase)
MTKYMGVDLSYCNGGVDYKSLKKAKIDGGAVKFAMLRTSYGCNKDRLLDKHYKGCKSAGIHVGAYHWLRAQNVAQARQEAQWLVKLLKNYSFDYPIALDFEDGDLFALELSKEQYSAIVDTFMSVLEKANYYVVLYTNPDTIRNRLTGSTLRKYDLWLSHWTHGKAPGQYGQTMWQFAAYGTAAEVRDGNATDVGTVSGSGGPVDCDVSYVGYAVQIRKAGKNVPLVKLTAEISVGQSKAEGISKKLKALGCSVKVDKSP